MSRYQRDLSGVSAMARDAVAEGSRVDVAPGNPSHSGSIGALPSMVSIALLLHANLGRDPVRLPRLSAVVGERLLEVRRGPCDVRPDVSNQYRASLVGLLV